MFKKLTEEKRSKNEKKVFLERKAAACLDSCLIMCTGPGGNTYDDETTNLCEAP